MQKFDIVTVAFKKEVPLLRLQAASIRKFFPAENLGKIIIVVNDVDEGDCIEALEEMLPEYGDFQKDVEIIRPDEIVSPALNFRDKTRRWLVENTFLQKKRRGWKGNSGWKCQQAFKLLAVSRASSSYVLILDAKNWFTRAVRSRDLVADCGKPLTGLIAPRKKQVAWVSASFAVLGGKYGGGPVSASITPCVYRRTFLADAVNYFEEKLGPLDYFFARNRRGATEFMLLWAFSEMKCGGWSNVFSEGLVECLATSRSSTKECIESRLRMLHDQHYFCAATHRDSFQTFSDEHSQELIESWIKIGLFRNTSDANIALSEMRREKVDRRGA